MNSNGRNESISLENLSFSVTTTRFTEQTYEQNKQYRTSRGIPAIYGTVRPLSSRCPLYSLVCVIEMNNTCNQIEGIAWVINRNHRGQHAIYSRAEHNLHIYIGHHWVSRDTLRKLNPDWCDTCEHRLFRGKRHMKRQQGITLVSEEVQELFVPFLQEYFQKHVSMANNLKTFDGNNGQQ